MSPLNLNSIRAEKKRRELLFDREEILKRCQTLGGFIREAWHVVEPAKEYVYGWHIDAIGQHLEAVTYGTLLDMGLQNRLLINVPPGMMKSLLISVFWPAWEWGPAGMPHNRYLATSYSQEYCKRDSRRMRDLVNSEWYRDLWPHVQLTRFGEMSFSNDKTGWRNAVPFSSLTGGRGDRVLIDDPHSVKLAESETQREEVVRLFREQVPTRLDNPMTSAIVVIMQRLHERDISGYIRSQAENMGYTVVCLPMEFEPESRCSTALGFSDPRAIQNELIFPERFPREVVERDKAVMGSYAVAGQFQQRPAPRGGGMFKRHWFEIVGAAPQLRKVVRKWDLAGTAVSVTSPDPDWTVGLLMGLGVDGLFYVLDVVRLRGSDLEVQRLIKNTTIQDNERFPGVWTVVPKDTGSSGKFVANTLVRMLAGFRAKAERETGSKQSRAEPFAAQCEAGNVKVVRGDWNEIYLNELGVFPSGAHDDQVDCSSGAFQELATRGEIITGAVTGDY